MSGLIPFDPSVPATNDNPSSDQPDMLTNNMSTLNILGVDHVTFNLNNGGQHTAITFNQDASYVPVSFPVTPPKLFTAPDAGGLAQLIYYTGTAAQGANQYGIEGSTGSIMLLAGVIIKWGNSNVIGTGPNLNFLSTFPNNCFGVQVTGTAQAYTGGFVVKNPTASGATIYRTDGSSGNTPYFYFAIGN
jgi:hypothetical protein